MNKLRLAEVLSEYTGRTITSESFEAYAAFYSNTYAVRHTEGWEAYIGPHPFEEGQLDVEECEFTQWPPVEGVGGQTELMS